MVIIDVKGIGAWMVADNESPVVFLSYSLVVIPFLPPNPPGKKMANRGVAVRRWRGSEVRFVRCFVIFRSAFLTVKVWVVHGHRQVRVLQKTGSHQRKPL